MDGEIKTELQVSTKPLDRAGPVQVPDEKFNYLPLPNIQQLDDDRSARIQQIDAKR